MKCSSCNSEIAENDRFCRTCGNSVTAIAAVEATSTNQIAAADAKVGDPIPRKYGLGAVGWLLMTLSLISLFGFITATIMSPTPPGQSYSSMAIGCAIIGGLIARYYRRSVILWSFVSFFGVGFFLIFIIGFLRAFIRG